jgi:hypothetical protein
MICPRLGRGKGGTGGGGMMVEVDFEARGQEMGRVGVCVAMSDVDVFGRFLMVAWFCFYDA